MAESASAARCCWSWPPWPHAPCAHGAHSSTHVAGQRREYLRCHRIAGTAGWIHHLHVHSQGSSDQPYVHAFVHAGSARLSVSCREVRHEAEGESFVGLHTLMYRARQLGKRHISALGNAHYNDYMATNVKFVTYDTCFFQIRALRNRFLKAVIAIEQANHGVGGPFNSTMLP